MADTRRARILVVEDDPLVIRVIVDVLKMDGHDVDMASNGREALERIAARPYDLILSDLLMPELDGVGLYRELVRRYPALVRRLAFVTGTVEPPEFESFLATTPVPVLHKPFDLAEIRRFIQERLG